MPSCLSCQHSTDHGTRGQSCPIFIITPDRFAWGCSQYAVKVEQSKQQDEGPVKIDDVPEKRIQSECERYLALHGVWFLHLSPKAREKEGTPDLLFAINGKAIAIEIKTECGRLTDAQQSTHEAMRRDGWDVRVIRSTTAFVNLCGEFGIREAEE